MDDALLLDTDSASRRLGISRSTLEKLRVYGGGPSYLKLGRSVRYRTGDLNNWLEQRVRYSTSETKFSPSRTQRSK